MYIVGTQCTCTCRGKTEPHPPIQINHFNPLIDIHVRPKHIPKPHPSLINHTHHTTKPHPSLTAESFWLSMCIQAPNRLVGLLKVMVIQRAFARPSSLDSQKVSVEPSVKLLLMASFEDVLSLPTSRMFSIRSTDVSYSIIIHNVITHVYIQD